MPASTPPTARKRKPPLANTLLNSAISHMQVALGFFNHPNQPHRYEIAAELALAAWEKVLKAFLHRAKPRFKIILPNGKTVMFTECREEVRRRLSATPELFLATSYNLALTYQYRNESAHLYGQDMDAVLHSLFAECVYKFAEFIRVNFKRELVPKENLGVLPVGFSRPVLPKDFLSNDSASAHAPVEVKDFLKAISDAGAELHNQGIAPEHSVLVTYYVHFEDSRKPAGADLVVRVDNSEDAAPTVTIQKHITATKEVRLSSSKYAPEVKLTDEQIWDYFNIDTATVQAYVRQEFPHVKFSNDFWKLLKRLGTDDTVMRTSYLDPVKKVGQGKKLYSDLVYQRLIDEYGVSEMADTPSSSAAVTSIAEVGGEITEAVPQSPTL
jgi:hypothetical protein